MEVRALCLPAIVTAADFAMLITDILFLKLYENIC